MHCWLGGCDQPTRSVRELAAGPRRVLEASRKGPGPGARRFAGSGTRGGEDWTISPSLGGRRSLSLGTEAARGALVDSNSRLSCCFESTPLTGQLVELSRSLLLDRVAELAHAVLTAGLSMMHGEELPAPFGVSVAWPAALDAETKLPSPRWGSVTPVGARSSPGDPRGLPNACGWRTGPDHQTPRSGAPMGSTTRMRQR